ncbi:hypothetical protein Hamer_G006607 [Homarus americanus]|uniref:Secreted protein n=1 Tax=Homarus americanus TaxID=6706 RepID=A0A8J5MMI1_HOMAM|nr:hypothetical protein Hamer_G006607 [Homarus americanus]
MNVKIVCFCIGLCVVVSSAVPVAQLTSVEGGDVEKPVDRLDCPALASPPTDVRILTCQRCVVGSTSPPVMTLSS